MDVYGQVTGNLGTTPVSYGSPLAVQTINTSYGDSAGNNDSAGGSELDAGYGTINGGNLYLFLAGNYENNGNHLNIFIQTSSGGQSTLNISGGWTGSGNNGETFSSGFAPTLDLDANDYEGTLYIDQYVLTTGGSANTYLGGIAGSPLGIYSATTFGGITFALNNNHTSQMGALGGATVPANMVAPNATTGLELALPLASFGWSSGPVEVMAQINGGGDNGFSNQTLPGQAVGSPNYPSQPFTAPSGDFFVVPEPSSISLVLVGLLGAIGLIRCRK